MKKTNLLLAASIAVLLSGCGGGSTTAPVETPATTENSAMALPDNITLARENDYSSANLASINYATFDDVGTDYSNQTQEIWINDGDYEALDIINGVMKIMTFTKATELANKGTYKILFKDPFGSSNTKQEAYVEVTRTDTNSTTPLYVKFFMSEDWGDGPLTRLEFAKINAGKSTTKPMGDFEMNMILLDNEDYSNASIETWEATAKTAIDPFYETMTIKVSPDATTAGQTNIQFELENDGEDVDSYLGTWYDKLHLAANIITTGAMDSGHGWMLKEMGIGENEYSYDDELFPSFDDKYIADRVGASSEGDTGSGLLSFRSQFDDTNYLYKIFNTDGSLMDTGHVISAFGFKGDNNNYGWMGENIAPGIDGDAPVTNTNTGSAYSAKYHYDSDLSVNDKITNYWTNDAYTVTAVDVSKQLVDLKNDNDQSVNIGGWLELDNGFYKNGNTLFPSWTTGDRPDQLTGNDVTIGDASYKVKPIIIDKSRIQVGEDGDYAELKNLSNLDAADIAQVKALTDQIAELSTITQNSGLDAFNSSILNNTYEWYRDTIKGKESDIPLRVVDGQVISTE